MATSNISQDYTITNYLSFSGERQGIRLNAAGSSVSFELTSTLKGNYTGPGGLNGQFIITNFDNQSKTFKFYNDSSGATGTLDGSGRVRINLSGVSGTDEFATQFVNAVNHANAFQGSILATKDTSNASKIILTQVKTGPGGDKTINWGAFADYDYLNPTNNFSGGSDGDAIVPFRMATKGAPNLRGQSLTGYYETFVGEQRT